MIISASRRTDIPAFYPKWFMNRIRAGYCIVPNPFNPHQKLRIDLTPDQVDVIVFWTRNPRPLFPYLPELDRLGYKYYFNFTLMNNPNFLDVNQLPLKLAVKTFQELSNDIGSSRVVWRYDPIVFSDETDIKFHCEQYDMLAHKLSIYTTKIVLSFMDRYAKNNRRLKQIEQERNIKFLTWEEIPENVLRDFLKYLFETTDKYKQKRHDHQIEIVSCAEPCELLAEYGIKPGKCIDDDYIKKVFKIEVTHKKDAAQRESCGCVKSQDIGMYDSCLFGCQYCYATTSFDKARANYRQHQPDSPSLLGWYEIDPKSEE